MLAHVGVNFNERTHLLLSRHLSQVVTIFLTLKCFEETLDWRHSVWGRFKDILKKEYHKR